MLGLCCSVGFSLAAATSVKVALTAVHGLLIVVASLVEPRALGLRTSIVAGHGLSSCSSQALEHRLSSHGDQTQLPCSPWDLPRSGIKLMCPAVQGGLSATGPPGKPYYRMAHISWSH